MVHRIPLATGGSRAFKRSRYTSEVMSVGTWTDDLLTKEAMKASRLGKGATFSGWAGSEGGVEGGVGREECDDEAGGSQRMTCAACFARCWIM